MKKKIVLLLVLVIMLSFAFLSISLGTEVSASSNSIDRTFVNSYRENFIECVINTLDLDDLVIYGRGENKETGELTYIYTDYKKINNTIPVESSGSFQVTYNTLKYQMYGSYGLGIYQADAYEEAETTTNNITAMVGASTPWGGVQAGLGYTWSDTSSFGKGKDCEIDITMNVSYASSEWKNLPSELKQYYTNYRRCKNSLTGNYEYRYALAYGTYGMQMTYDTIYYYYFTLKPAEIVTFTTTPKTNIVWKKWRFVKETEYIITKNNTGNYIYVLDSAADEVILRNGEYYTTDAEFEATVTKDDIKLAYDFTDPAYSICKLK